ncbi:MAG: cytochrome c [Nitrospiraceae bacterium]|nr:cytochrome c [Nitrospiraceae bacterium]
MNIMQYIFPAIGVFGIAVAVFAAVRKSPFFNFIGILIAIYGGLMSMPLIMPPLPAMIIHMYMATAFLTFLIYFSISDETWKAFLRPIRAVLADEDKKVMRVAIVYIFVPLLAAYIAYAGAKPAFAPPVTPRETHPEPPMQMTFKGQTINILKLQNPLRENAAQLNKYTEDGKKVYFQNCFFCHGADLSGKGVFAKAFNPPPPPFMGTDTIAQLPESYVFWRVSKGWAGLPSGSHPWDSAMPQFENWLDQNSIWDVSIYIYSATGNKPRTF